MSKTPFTVEAVQPTREILFIERAIDDDTFGDSNIVRPDSARQEMGLATVLAVGPEVNFIVPGNQVYLGKMSGLKLTELNGSYFLVHQNEIMAIVGNDDEE